MKRVAIILAGGHGTRLWPLSDEKHPKPLLEIFNKKSMLEETFFRASLFADSIYILTEADKAELIRQHLAELDLHSDVLVESEHAGTEAAIAFAVAAVEQRHGKSAAVALLPIDHRVRNVGAFYRDMSYAIDIARDDKLMLFGVVPSFPATGYGYIRLGEKTGQYERELQFSIDTFLEKPDKARANEFLKSADYVWNSGIYVGTVRAFTSVFKLDRLLYDWYERLAAGGDDPLPAGLREKQFEQAIIERAKDLRVITATFDWTDIGTYDSLYRSVLQTDEHRNAMQGRTVIEGCSDCLIMGNRKKIIALGLKDIAVIDGPDGILVCNKTAYSQLIGQIATGERQPHDHHAQRK